MNVGRIKAPEGSSNQSFVSIASENRSDKIGDVAIETLKFTPSPSNFSRQEGKPLSTIPDFDEVVAVTAEKLAEAKEKQFNLQKPSLGGKK